MATWQHVIDAAPDLARAAQARIEVTGLAFMATLRADGWPRISGIEPLFAHGEVWMGMMPGSRKAADLQRDPRLALHNASVDKAVTAGDVKVTGRGIEVLDDDTFQLIVAAFTERNGVPPPPGPFHLFKVDVTEVAMIRPAGDRLAIEWWREGEDQVHLIERT